MQKTLTRSLFQKCPVWKWDESQESHEPVWDWQPLARDEPTYFIKADFTTNDGVDLNGYLVGHDTFYAIGIFIEDYEYVLNLNLADMMEDSIKEICQKMGRAELDVFPLKYQTEVNFEGEESLGGSLTL